MSRLHRRGPQYSGPAAKFVGAVSGFVFCGVGVTVLVSLWAAPFGAFGSPPLFFRIVASFIAVAFVAVGSNLEAQQNIPRALDCLLQRVTVTGSSTFCQTTPLGPPGQPLFVNGVWQIQTDLPPRQVISQLLHPIESRLGRTRTSNKFAPRPIDLDLILYRDWVLQEEDLVLPHPDIERPFVWAPIMELLNAIPLDPKLVRSMKNLLLPQRDISNWGIPLGELTQTLRRTIQS